MRFRVAEFVLIVCCMLQLRVLWSSELQPTSPNHTLTPGVSRGLTKDEICTTKWGRDERHVTEGMKKQVFASYRVAWADRSLYEVDHLISRELGGADDVKNLWPQPYNVKMGAHQKDQLENHLHKLVCAGTLELATAQHDLATDWIIAYHAYMGVK